MSAKNDNAPERQDRDELQKPVGPGRILRILALAAALLLTVIAIIPSGRLEIAGDLALRFVSLDALTGAEAPRYADIGHILAAHSEELEEGSGAGEGAEEPSGDRAKKKPRPLPAPKDAEKLAKSLRRIENPKALKSFFQALEEDSPERVVRIAHYGDSQIEGDRITGFLRQRFQSAYGGCGVGLIPMYEPMPLRLSVVQEAEGGWHRYVPYGRLDESIPHSRFGIMGAIFRYQPYPPPPSEGTGGIAPAVERPSGDEDLTAGVSVKTSQKASPNARYFEVVRLLVGDVETPLHYEFRTGEREADLGLLVPSERFRAMEWRLEAPGKEFGLRFRSAASPDFYGMALDCPAGVAVDNIPLRGSSGIFVHRWNRQSLGRQLEELNARLVIWQFGVNVVPYIEERYDYYQRYFQLSLESLQEAFPGVSVLVVAVSDMARKDDAGYYESYPNVEGIRDAQRRAALDAGAAFWDLHKAMGGRNSMPSWVRADLATEDYTHFSSQGARIVARMFYNALQDARQEVLGPNEGVDPQEPPQQARLNERR